MLSMTCTPVYIQTVKGLAPPTLWTQIAITWSCTVAVVLRYMWSDCISLLLCCSGHAQLLWKGRGHLLHQVQLDCSHFCFGIGALELVEAVSVIGPPNGFKTPPFFPVFYVLLRELGLTTDSQCEFITVWQHMKDAALLYKNKTHQRGINTCRWYLQHAPRVHGWSPCCC